MKNEYKPLRDSRLPDEISCEEALEHVSTDNLIDELDTFKDWFPILKQLKTPNQYSPEQVAKLATPAAMAKMLQIMATAKSEKLQFDAAKEIAYMGGMKPVERTQNMNLTMPKEEAAALLANELERYGIKVVNNESTNEQ